MSTSLNTDIDRTGSVICTYQDGTRAGMIHYRPKASILYEAVPENGGTMQAFRSLEAAEFYILAWAAEHAARKP